MKQDYEIDRGNEKQMDNLWEYLEDYQIATPEEIKLVTQINGTSLETLENILYARTGYRSLEQINYYDED